MSESDAAHNDLLIELDGPGVSPDSLDAPLALELVAAFLSVVEHVAVQAGVRLGLRGIAIVDKCAAFKVSTSSPALAQQTAARANRYVSGEEEPPRGAGEPVQRVRRALSRLPPDHTARIIVGPWSTPLVGLAHQPVAPPQSTVSLRAIPVRVGGKLPKVRLQSHAEKKDFSLSISQAQARELGGSLYREVDLVAVVMRDDTGAIESGVLDSFELVEDGGASEAWTNWFREARGEEPGEGPERD